MSGIGEGVNLVDVIFAGVGGVTVCESGCGPGCSKIPEIVL